MSRPHEYTMDIKVALSRLKENRDDLDINERRELATTVGRALVTSGPSEDVLALMEILARDPIPEIRTEIAGLLVHLSTDLFISVASIFGDDTNAYVKKAVERAIERRRRSAQQTQRTRKKMNAVKSRILSFEGVYGREATRQLRRIANEEFSSLVRQMDHDIRQILSPIKTSIATLTRQVEGPFDQRFCLDTLKNMDHRMVYMEKFLSDLKEYAKAAPLERRRERLIDIVREARSIAYSALRETNKAVDRIAFEIDIPEPMTAYVARHQILIALVHIIRNAVEAFDEKFSRRRGRKVTVQAVSTEPNRITITIKDNACGILPEDLEVLREFVPGRGTNKLNGTGFGLPTSAQYVAAHGGTLTIDSVKEEGTTLTITLPMNLAEDEL